MAPVRPERRPPPAARQGGRAAATSAPLRSGCPLTPRWRPVWLGHSVVQRQRAVGQLCGVGHSPEVTGPVSQLPFSDRGPRAGLPAGRGGPWRAGQKEQQAREEAPGGAFSVADGRRVRVSPGAPGTRGGLPAAGTAEGGNFGPEPGLGSE